MPMTQFIAKIFLEYNILYKGIFMKKNLLKEKNVKIVLTYNDNNSINSYPVSVRFQDDKECILSTELRANFHKPKPKTKAVIEGKTKDAVFKSDVVVNDCSASLNDLTIFVKLSNVWNISELRGNIRLKIDLPFRIKYKDGFEIATVTADISSGGFKFYSDIYLSDEYKTSVTEVTIKLPNGENFTANTKYLRSDESDIFNSEKAIVYKFINLSMSQSMILNNFIKETYTLMEE